MGNSYIEREHCIHPDDLRMAESPDYIKLSRLVRDYSTHSYNKSVLEKKFRIKTDGFTLSFDKKEGKITVHEQKSTQAWVDRGSGQPRYGNPQVARPFDFHIMWIRASGVHNGYFDLYDYIPCTNRDEKFRKEHCIPFLIFEGKAYVLRMIGSGIFPYVEEGNEEVLFPFRYIPRLLAVLREREGKSKNVDDSAVERHQEYQGHKTETSACEDKPMKKKAPPKKKKPISDDTSAVITKVYEETSPELESGFVPARMYEKLQEKYDEASGEIITLKEDLAEARAELKHITSGRTIEDATVEAIQAHHQTQAEEIKRLEAHTKQCEYNIDELEYEREALVKKVADANKKIADLERVRDKLQTSMKFMREECFPYLTNGEEDLAEEANDRLCNMEEEIEALRVENGQILEMMNQILEKVSKDEGKGCCGPCGFQEDLLPDKFQIVVGQPAKDEEHWAVKWLKVSEKTVTVIRIVLKIVLGIMLIGAGVGLHATGMI